MRSVYCLVSLGLASSLALSGARAADPTPPAPAAAALAATIREAYGDAPPPEGARMLTAILEGSRMGPGEGWFGPAETRFGYPWLAERHGIAEPDAGIPRDRFVGADDLFAVLDRNRDGVIQPADLDWSDSNPYVQLAYSLNRIFRRLDAGGSGKLSREAWDALFDGATGADGVLSADEFAAVLLKGEGAGFAKGDAPTMESLLKGLLAGEIGSMLEGPKVGDRAPVFRLRRVKGEGTVAIDELVGEKPLVLVFGNFTCGPFRAFYPAVDALYETYGDRVNFLMVYVREAHPDDGWKMESNTKAGVAVMQPKSFADRVEVAGAFCSRLDPRIPVVVDDVADPVGNAYSGMPARLYLVDRDGRIAFKSGRGPFGFKPRELEQALAMLLLEREGATGTAVRARADAPGDPAAGWSLLPAPVTGGGLPLPNWATAVAKRLPRTAAALLQLDHAQRTKSPLEPRLRAKARYVIADTNRCEYARATALTDLRSAGAAPDEVERFLAGSATWADDEKDALVFAQQHSRDAPGIDDALVARLRQRYGDRGFAALVLLGAYGNFQDRLLLGLGVEREGEVPLGPLPITFDPSVFQTQPLVPASRPITPPVEGGRDVVADDDDWAALSYGVLQERLEAQRHREQRLPTPTWEEVAARLPPGFTARPTRIVWNLVCMGYVPELAVPWTTATRTMWAEAPQDRVFEESLFWVQTRAVQCNYCMGHCEMLLGVAGLAPGDIDRRLRALAGDDWSAFPEAEQRAFAYARKLTATPWALTRADYEVLERDLGPEGAMAVFFWLCRGLYMTRVSDGFQLRLEADNVFADHAAAPPPQASDPR